MDPKAFVFELLPKTAGVEVEAKPAGLSAEPPNALPNALPPNPPPVEPKAEGAAAAAPNADFAKALDAAPLSFVSPANAGVVEADLKTDPPVPIEPKGDLSEPEKAARLDEANAEGEVVD